MSDNKLNILFAAAEVVPFAKTGGLADVASALPKAIGSLGHNIIVVMPRYYKIDTSELEKIDSPLGVSMGVMGKLWAAVYKWNLPHSKVPIYFIDYEEYFCREGLYEDKNGEFGDNDKRFIFFSKAALELCKLLQFTPDIIHANDWHTAAMPLLSKTMFYHDFAHAASVITIHNLQHQGNFDKAIMDVMEVGWEHFNPLEFESYGRMNLLKGAITHADAITTVSKKYAQEIQTVEFGFGLEKHIQEVSDKLFGILNGVDYEEWSPSTDEYLVEKYDVRKISGKSACKADIQKYFNLPVREDVALIGFVGRFAEQKGIGLIAGVLESILDLDVQVIMLGTGESWAEEFFSDISYRRENFGLYVGYSDALAHKIEAGSDMFLMPSLFEPCGLNQIYSLSYGTLPIVRATGGLDDTIVNFDESNHQSNGFKFYEASNDALYHTIYWAIDTYYRNPKAFEKMKKHSMKEHFGWNDSAKEYIEVYKYALERKRGR